MDRGHSGDSGVSHLQGAPTAFYIASIPPSHPGPEARIGPPTCRTLSKGPAPELTDGVPLGCALQATGGGSLQHWQGATSLDPYPRRQVGTAPSGTKGVPWLGAVQSPHFLPQAIM